MRPIQRDRSRAKARTRKAILEAAITVLGRAPAASMEEIAQAAETARSTVHRHFPERADLIAALRTYADEQLEDAAIRARLGEGTAFMGLLRLCQEYFERGDLLMAAYANFTQAEELDSMDAMDEGLVRLVERGHADGSIDPALSPIWVQQVLWSMLYAAWLMTTAGKASKHEALTLFLDSFGKVLSPRNAKPVEKP